MGGAVQSIDYVAMLPVLVIGVGVVTALLSGAFGAPRAAVTGVSIASLAVALATLPAARGRSTFGGAYVTDDFTTLFQAVVLGAAIVVLLLSFGEIIRSEIPVGEFCLLLLSAIVGALTLVAARDLIMLVVALETLSLPVFALVALRRYDGVASEAALKLFLVSVISSAISLFGISLIYGVTGSMRLDRIAVVLAHPPHELRSVAVAGIVLTIAGFGFKVAAVPFHFWAPDVYQGAPLPVAAFLSVVSKAAGFAGLILVLTIGFAPYGHVWGPVIGVLAAVTMTVGNLIALRQRDAVRLLAWSSVAQSGYMLAPLAIGASRHLSTAVAATGTYVAMYAVMNIGAFAVVSEGGRRIDDYRGLGRRSPFLGAALAFFLLCLAGLPPGLMGLFAKIVVFRAVVDGSATWLAVVMAVNTVIGLYYYLGWGVRLFQPSLTTPSASRAAPVVAVAVALAGAVVFSVAPELVMHAAASALP
jgi:NADH-quinone oxidoreductase subunit N